MFNAAHMTYKSASLTLTFWTKTEATLLFMLSNDKRKGHATQLLKNLERFCDDKGMTVRLEVDAFDEEDGGMNNDQLREFYEKFGFVVDEEDDDWIMMERKPKQNL